MTALPCSQLPATHSTDPGIPASAANTPGGCRDNAMGYHMNGLPGLAVTWGGSTGTIHVRMIMRTQPVHVIQQHRGVCNTRRQADEADKGRHGMGQVTLHMSL